MRMIATRELAANPGKVMALAEAEGGVVITEDGKTRVLMLPTSDQALLADWQDLVFLRAKHTLLDAQLPSAAAGLDAMGMEEIDAEIHATRADRKVPCRRC